MKTIEEGRYQVVTVNLDENLRWSLMKVLDNGWKIEHSYPAIGDERKYLLLYQNEDNPDD